MLSFSIAEVVAATGAEALYVPSVEPTVTQVTIDSRQVEAGSLFVAFVGEHVNGNELAPAAALAGAAAVVLSEAPSAEALAAAQEAGCAVLRAAGDDGEEFLLRLAGAWRRANAQWCVVGVTGSVGKTTTKDMLAAALGATLRVHATTGNHNNLIGMPLTLLGASPDDEVVVVEMGMNAPGEIARLSACARPQVAAITNVGTAHIGMLGSRKAIADAKAEIVGGMQATAAVKAPVLVMPAAGDFTSYIETTYAVPAGVGVKTVGASGTSAWAESLELDDEGHPSFCLCLEDGTRRQVRLGALGRHVVDDFLIVMEVVALLGANCDVAADAVGSMPATHMRLEVLSAAGAGPRVIDDSYNASPTSMASALDVLASMRCDGRRVAVLGEMGELGDDAERLHGYVGAYAAATAPDLLVVIGVGHAHALSAAARTMGFPEDALVEFPTVDAALGALAPVFDRDDLVLVKGSHAAGLDTFVKGVVEYAG